MTPNRVAVLLTSVAALLGGLAPVVANMDVTSTVGIVAGIGGVVAVVNKWLTGWQRHEAQVARVDPATTAPR